MMNNKKGLIVTLLSVAFACAYGLTHAAAPVIDDPGDLIVGDLEQGAGNNLFAFPDAFSLDGIVVDDTTADSAILWSYSGAGKYRVNGVLGLSGPDNPTTPPGAKELRSNDADLGHLKSGGAPQDATGETVTVRNNDLSPLPGLGPYGEPATTGLLDPAETQAVTLFASDGSTNSFQTIVVYTANETSDSLSKGLIPIFDFDYENNPGLRTGWLSRIDGGLSAGTTGTGSGFCMWVPLVNVSTAAVYWFSPNNPSTPNVPGYITLVDNAVYRLRTYMWTDTTANGAIPFWTFGYNNNMYMPTLTSNVYGGDLYVLDVAGGANGIGRTQGRTIFDFWEIPNAALTQQWRGTLPGGNPDNARSVVNNANVDNRNDTNISVRILDGNSAISSDGDTGTICLKRVVASRIDFSKLSATLLDGPPINTATHGVLPDTEPGTPGNGTMVISNGTDAVTGIVGFATANVGPSYETNINGGRKRFLRYNPAGTSINLRQFPMVNSWRSDELLLVKSKIRSGVSGGAGSVEGTDPINLIFFDWEGLTSEIGGFHFTQKAAGGMRLAPSPRLYATNGNVSQEYVSVFYTQNKSRSAQLFGGAEAQRIRGYIDVYNNSGIGSTTDGINPFVVNSLELYKVDTAGF